MATVQAKISTKKYTGKNFEEKVGKATTTKKDTKSEKVFKAKSKKKEEDPFNFPKFEDIPVSTKTFVIAMNTILDIEKIFQILPITEYIVIPKRRGRKKKNEQEDPNKHIPTGSIITLKYREDIRGVDLKKKKTDEKKTGSKKYFRNSVTIVMVVDGKKINFKLSKNGTLQMTGCKFDRHAEICVEYIWDFIREHKEVYTIQGEYLKVLYIPAMRNIDFAVNFLIDREKLDEYFNLHTEHNSLLETSIGYTGVNIKKIIKKPIEELTVKKIEYKEGGWQTPKYIHYGEYLATLPEKERNKKLKKTRYNTFLVFHSGKIIQSGISQEFMRDAYYEFLDIIRDCYDVVQEKLNI